MMKLLKTVLLFSEHHRTNYQRIVVYKILRKDLIYIQN